MPTSLCQKCGKLVPCTDQEVGVAVHCIDCFGLKDSLPAVPGGCNESTSNPPSSRPASSSSPSPARKQSTNFDFRGLRFLPVIMVVCIAVSRGFTTSQSPPAKKPTIASDGNRALTRPPKLTEEDVKLLAKITGHQLATTHVMRMMAPAVWFKELHDTPVAKSTDLVQLRRKLVKMEEEARKYQNDLQIAREEYEQLHKDSPNSIDKSLIDACCGNEALHSDFASLWADLREWTYSAEVLGRKKESGDLLIEILFRSLNGDPFSTPKEFQRQHDAGSIQYAKLNDQLYRLIERQKALLNQSKPVVSKYFPKQSLK